MCTANDAFGAQVDFDQVDFDQVDFDQVVVQAEEITRLQGQLVEAREQITTLQGQVATANDQRRRSAQIVESAREGLQQGLLGMDKDDAELIRDFLNDHSPWEFTLTLRYRVTLHVEVLVDAESEDEAENFEYSLEVQGADFSETDTIEVRSVDEEED